MSLFECLEKLKYDKRMTDWNLTEKKITEEEIQKHLDSLEDVSHLADPVKLEEPTSE